MIVKRGGCRAGAPLKKNIADICYAFLTANKRQLESGESAPRTWRDY